MALSALGSLLAMALAVHDSGLELDELDGSVTSGGGVTIELRRAAAVQTSRNLGAQVIGFAHPVPWCPRALRDLAQFLLVILNWVLSVAPWFLLALIRVAAVVVVANTVAPPGKDWRIRVISVKRLSGVCNWLNGHGICPWVVGCPLLARAAAGRGSHQSTVALALSATFLTNRVLDHVASEFKAGQFLWFGGVRLDCCCFIDNGGNDEGPHLFVAKWGAVLPACATL